MSPYLFSADLGRTEIGLKARTITTVADALTLSIADLFAEYADARRSGDPARMAAVRDYAAGMDADLVAELDGFDYPAAA
ncbi:MULTISPECIES: hypothetical protein [Streptomyces]|uniref:hypothetical protein n=1 Tax=Streptomyces TaxID=1883 RepID=UPI0006AF74D5|nr:hypothetical protein [Streptomyces sp. NRRL F-4707]KOX32824.1 hypothetical protein ADL07_11710 [Streptomyces sp. NRRL F-4707]